MKPLPSAVLGAILTLAAACGSSADERVRVIDLMRQLANAETRPVAGTFEIAEHSCGGQPRASVSVPANSRVTWPVTLPDRAALMTAAGLSGPPGSRAAFRVGISDERIYEQLSQQMVTTDACGRGWTPIEVGLGNYSGWKFSLFYQPSGKAWRIVLGVGVEGGDPERAFWAVPAIYSDNSGAEKFYRRQQ